MNREEKIRKQTWKQTTKAEIAKWKRDHLASGLLAAGHARLAKIADEKW